jgi:hypothetical protein
MGSNIFLKITIYVLIFFSFCVVFFEVFWFSQKFSSGNNIIQVIITGLVTNNDDSNILLKEFVRVSIVRFVPLITGVPYSSVS